MRRLNRRGALKVGDRYRQALSRAREISASDPSLIARQWACWAEKQVEDTDADWAVAQAAEAYWELIRQFPLELHRRHTPAEQARVAREAQGTAAAAGYWLARAGRVDDALIAVETARAVLLTSLTLGSSDVTIDRGLLHRRELLERYRLTRGRYEKARREQYRDAETTDANAAQTLSPAQIAWGALQSCLYDMALASGRPMAELPGVNEVHSVARDGDLVYIAAGSVEGYALHVRLGSPTRHIRLPELVESNLVARVEEFEYLLGSSSWYSNPKRFATLLDWLGTAVVGPVLDRATSDTVTVVPLGLLSLLPLQAAILGGQSTGEPEYALDRVSLRYAPNSRLLAWAQKSVKTRGGNGRVVAVQVGDALGRARLDHVAAEARGVAERHGRRGLLRIDPSVTQALSDLEGADVWHLACHGVADENDPLASSLVMADGSLRVRDLLMGSSSEHRLAVLSACVTAVPDHTRLDEVISLPGALMSIGVAGVIATQWSTDDEAAMFLMLRLHTLIAGGHHPAWALTEAQRWIRQADHASLSAELSGETAGVRGTGSPSSAGTSRPFASPRYWAGFTYTGT